VPELATGAIATGRRTAAGAPDPFGSGLGLAWGLGWGLGLGLGECPACGGGGVVPTTGLVRTLRGVCSSADGAGDGRPEAVLRLDGEGRGEGGCDDSLMGGS